VKRIAVGILLTFAVTLLTVLGPAGSALGAADHQAVNKSLGGVLPQFVAPADASYGWNAPRLTDIPPADSRPAAGSSDGLSCVDFDFEPASGTAASARSATSVQAPPYPLADTFKLHSLPGAKLTLLLDFGPRTLADDAYTRKPDLSSLALSGAGDVFAAGDFETFLHYDGSSWTVQKTNFGWGIGGMDMVSLTDGWAVGFQGSMYHYVNGSWSAVNPSTMNNMNAVDMLSATDGWAVGDNGTILRYAGGSWTVQSSPTTQNLRDVEMVSASEGWAVGFQGTILHYAGGSWNTQASPSTYDILGLSMLSPAEGWAVSINCPAGVGTILHYAGGSWSPQPSHWSSLTGVDMLSASDGWAVGPGGVIAHYDGTSWTGSTSPTTAQLNKVRMVSASDGWAVGREGAVLRYTSGTWNLVQGVPVGGPIDCPAWSLDGDPAFSDAEKAMIQEAWQRVAEDYAPFNIDVTTELTSEAAITRSDPSDSVYGMRVLAYGQPSNPSGGVAQFGAFNEVGDYNKPALVHGQSTANKLADCISHESGHTFALNHDSTPTEVYYPGSGSGPTGWAPIMGGFDRELTQWSKGEYPLATNQEDDLAIIAGYLGYRPDDVGDSAAAATTLALNPGASASGLIGSATDVDVYRFDVSTSGPYAIGVKPVPAGPNLDILAELRDANGTLVASSNPPDELFAQLDPNLSAGTYYLSVRGTGKGSPLDVGGYSSYGSIGQYSLSVTRSTTATPAILRLTPRSARRGALVVIGGSGFGASRGASFVKFGAKRCASYLAWSDTSITCKVPAAATPGKVNVTVTTAAGASNAKRFVVKR